MQDNPQDWNDVEKAIYDARKEARRAKEGEGISLETRIYRKLSEGGFLKEETDQTVDESRPWLEAIDHIAYVVSPATIRKWAWFYIDIMGGKLTKRLDDSNPDGKSSMMLWEIDFGKFAIALVAGIDRSERSHVSTFNFSMGDRMVQHLAFRVRDENLEAFIEHLAEYGMHFQGEMLTRPEGSGTVRQIFGQPVDDRRNSADSGFDEFQARPSSDAPITFSGETAAELYEMAQDLTKSKYAKPMLDWPRMSEDWEPPEVQE